MTDDKYLEISRFCELHQVKEELILEYVDYELITVHRIENKIYLTLEQVPVLERIIRLNTELEINPAGINAIFHLQEKIESYENEIQNLRNKLKSLM